MAIKFVRAKNLIRHTHQMEDHDDAQSSYTLNTYTILGKEIFFIEKTYEKPRDKAFFHSLS